MDVRSACDYINGDSFVYKPGWTFVAQDYTYRMGDAILLTITFDALSSDREDARNGYKVILEPLVTTFPIIVRECRSEDDLLFQVLLKIIELETHEAREFLRKRATYAAPYHPHRHDCMVRWAEKNNIRTPDGSPDISRDLNYGAFAPVPASRRLTPDAITLPAQTPSNHKPETVLTKIIMSTSR